MHRFMAAVGVALFGLALCVFAPAALAQGVTGTISGTVKDSAGGVIAGSQIEVLHEDTGSSRQLTSDSAGRYSATFLSLGNYKVTAKATGLQTEVRSGIVLTVGREAVVDFALMVGAT